MKACRFGCGGIQEIRRVFQSPRVTVPLPGSAATSVLAQHAITRLVSSPFGLGAPPTAFTPERRPFSSYFQCAGAAHRASLS